MEQTSPPFAIQYLLTAPDGGEDAFWTWPNHDASSWCQATNLLELGKIVRTAKAREVWVRMDAQLTSESINNSYFSIRHSGPIEIYVNGLKRVNAPRAAEVMTDYRVGPRRPESIGQNVYAIHFTHAAGATPIFEIAWHDQPFHCSDSTTKQPDSVLSEPIRDAQVCRGPDGVYYLTGTTGDAEFLRPGTNSWLRNPGIQLFQSADLQHWQSLGWVWTFERDGTWNRDFGTFGGRGPARAVFAPEIHYLKGKFWLVYSVNHTTAKHAFGIGLACADKPTGPWREMSPDKPLTDGFDPTLFEDDDGFVYLLKHGGEIVRLNSDMTALTGKPRHLSAANYPHVGYEGVYLFKQHGTYYLTAAEWNVHPDGAQSYDSMVAVSTNLFGPYGPRYCALRYGGHNSYFTNASGGIMATIWCYPDQSPHWQRVSLVKMIVNDRQELQPQASLDVRAGD